MNTHHGVSRNGETTLDIKDIARISYGIGNRGIAATLDLARFDLSGFAELLVCLAREIVDPDQKDQRDWFAPYILRSDAAGRRIHDIDHLSAFIAIDIDAAGWTINRITNRMDGHAFIAYTTTKSRPDHQRWRVIAFLSRDYTVAEHAAIWDFLNKKFDMEVDASTKDASRISYAPAQWVGADNQFHLFSGLRLDVDDVLKTYQPVGIKPSVYPIIELPSTVCLPNGMEIITPKMIAEFASAPPGGRFYRLLCAAATRCRMNSWSISAAELCAAAMMVSSTDSSGAKRHDPCEKLSVPSHGRQPTFNPKQQWSALEAVPAGAYSILEGNIMKNNIIRLPNADNEALRKARAKEQEEQDYLDAAAEWLNERPMRYSTAQGRYLMKIGSNWKFIKPESMKPFCPVWDAKFANAIRANQYERNWLHMDITYSFRRDIHSDIFNLMDTSGWVQPGSGDHHWIFDVLMRSLGSGKAENIEHLEQVILYKYLHPECYLLPCLVIHGEGGVGKNLLVDKVLHTMFDGQTVSAASDNITGQFNSLAKGRTVVMINESVSDRADTATLKDMLHKERLVINEKGIPQFEIDNTPLYIIASNEHEGGVFLDRSDADRRYSVLRCERGKTLNHWIAEHTGWPQDQARAWMAIHGHQICGDKAEIGKWLGYLMDKYRDHGQPVALHGADYAALMDVQKKMEERLVEAVFGDADFTHIERKVLYQGYTILCQSAHIRPLSDARFYKRVDDWLANNMPQIAAEVVWVDGYVIDDDDPTKKKRTKKRRYVWQVATPIDMGSVAGVANRDNRDEYLASDGYRTLWCGPDV